MKTKKGKQKTVFICSNNDSIHRAGGSLVKMVDGELFGKSYYFYYRKLLHCDSFLFSFKGVVYKIQKVYYD